MEGGVVDTGSWLVDQFSVARMYIDFSDVAEPTGTVTYPQAVGTGTVAMIAVIAAAVGGLALVIVWKLCRRRRGEATDPSLIPRKEKRD
jgi:uncharacterized membrane-anchored protein